MCVCVCVCARARARMKKLLRLIIICLLARNEKMTFTGGRGRRGVVRGEEGCTRKKERTADSGGHNFNMLEMVAAQEKEVGVNLKTQSNKT